MIVRSPRKVRLLVTTDEKLHQNGYNGLYCKFVNPKRTQEMPVPPMGDLVPILEYLWGFIFHGLVDLRPFPANERFTSV
jgi:hypothetical protein